MKNTRKIKPLIISRTLPYLGGREVVVDMLIKSFSQNGPVCVLTPDNYPKQKNVRVHKTDDDFDKILKWVQGQQVDVINCHTFYLSDLAFFLSKKLRVPLVFTLHGVFINFYGKRYGKILKKIYTKSDSVITVSDNYKKTLGKYVGSLSKLTTVKNGINLELIDKVRRKSPSYYRKKNGLPKNKFIVMIPARLTYLKGLDYLMEAIKTNTEKEIMFLVCSPNGRNNTEEITYKNKLKSCLKNSPSTVRFLNLNQEKVLEYYQSADVVLLPSLIEGLSISLLEAMAFEKIVVATRVGGNPEIIHHEKNGYLIKPKNPKAIKKIILFLKKNRKSSVAKNGRKTVEKYFSKDTMVRNYYKIFQKIGDENK